MYTHSDASTVERRKLNLEKMTDAQLAGKHPDFY